MGATVWSSTSARAKLLALLPAVALAAAGCGVGGGESASGTRLLITKDFGRTVVKDLPSPQSAGSDTVMRLLQRNAKVETRYGGGFVQAIDGTAGGRRGASPVDWFYSVNGVLAEKGAAATKVRAGETIWWDFHDWSAAGGSKAVVGAFPEPFRSGLDGKKLPVRVECTVPDAPVCAAVQKKFTDLGIVSSQTGLQGALSKETLRVLVGTWQTIRVDQAARQLETGPDASGVYARPAKDGRSIAFLDDTGATSRTAGAGTGLVAATRVDDARPVWLVTGTDQAGVDAAASALDQGALDGKYALAVVDGRGVALPEAPK